MFAKTTSMIGSFCLPMFLLGACAAPIDRAAELEALLATDRAFDLASGAHGAADAFGRFLVDDALQLPRNGPAIKGRKRIAEVLAGDYSLRWQPQGGEVSERGDMGYTWGVWQLSLETQSDSRTERGKYLNVWVKRGEDWRVLVDLGNQADRLPE